MSDTKKYYINNGATITKGKSKIKHGDVISYEEIVSFFSFKNIIDDIERLEKAESLINEYLEKDVYMTDKRFENALGEVRDGSNPVRHSDDVVEQIEAYANQLEKEGASKEDVLEVRLQQFGVPKIKTKVFTEVKEKEYKERVKQATEKSKAKFDMPWRNTRAG